MADFSIIVDVAKFQRSDLAFFQYLKDNGVKGVIVQITAGTDGFPYSQNPRAADQINNAIAAGLVVAVYHYSYSAGAEGMEAEAENFINQFNALGLDKEKCFAFLDEEDNTYNSADATDDVNNWLQSVANAGIKNTGTYSMSSWFKSGRINQSKLISNVLWVASYGTSEPGVDNTDIWQFTDNWNGVDASYDFNSLLLGNTVVKEQPQVQLQPDNVQPQTEWQPVTYVIKAGDTLTKISLETQDSISTIIANNPDVFPQGIDSTIYPGTKLLVNNRGTDFNAGGLSQEEYTIQSGDTLYGIASYLGDRVDTVVANNPDVFHGNMNTTIYPGQTILYYR